MMYRWSGPNNIFIDLSPCSHQTSHGLWVGEIQPEVHYNDSPNWEKLL